MLHFALSLIPKEVNRCTFHLHCLKAPILIRKNSLTCEKSKAKKTVCKYVYVERVMSILCGYGGTLIFKGLTAI